MRPERCRNTCKYSVAGNVSEGCRGQLAREETTTMSNCSPLSVCQGSSTVANRYPILFPRFSFDSTRPYELSNLLDLIYNPPTALRLPKPFPDVVPILYHPEEHTIYFLL